ncbi:surface lipoprotein assembly modifier, partial [uncultured Caulobacter sp.]|uniref:surface lipoprotein assembly modifier n=1 Tax=uncultured Caulobacter sp. TaxID=158749 RepID=UPI00260FF03B
SLFLMGSYRHRRHRAYSELFEAQRRDRQFNVIGIARLPILKLGPLVPEIVVQHNRVTSNIDWLYSYKRTTASVRLSYAF